MGSSKDGDFIGPLQHKIYHPGVLKYLALKSAGCNALYKVLLAGQEYNNYRN